MFCFLEGGIKNESFWFLWYLKKGKILVWPQSETNILEEDCEVVAVLPWKQQKPSLGRLLLINS